MCDILKLALIELASCCRTYDGFVKKIQDYMRLADMQSSRGLIDKAIEVNQSALKFCKDKDEASKAQLEAQKKTLIDLKLKQSIERIEKNKTAPDGQKEGDEVEHNRDHMLALKQALTGQSYKQPVANAKTATAGVAAPGTDVYNNNNNNGGHAQGKKTKKQAPNKASATPQINGIDVSVLFCK